MSASVLVDGLRKRYGEVTAADGVSFEVRDGEIFGLIGPNGAGKTTTVECVIGLREPDGGRIEVCGIDARARPQEVKQRIGAALQTVALQDAITPREAMALFGSFYRKRLPPAHLLDRFGLADKADAAFETLSGGQRQRLALALAFVNDPELVFLDEPTAGLDVQVRRDLRAEIARMRQDGRAVLLTTHDIDEAQVLCDRIAIIDHGRVVASGSPADLVAGSHVVPTVSLVTTGPVDPSWFAALPGIADVACEGTRMRCRTSAVGHALATIASILNGRGLDLVDVVIDRPTLEDVLIELTAPAARP